MANYSRVRQFIYIITRTGIFRCIIQQVTEFLKVRRPAKAAGTHSPVFAVAKPSLWFPKTRGMNARPLKAQPVRFICHLRKYLNILMPPRNAAALISYHHPNGGNPSRRRRDDARRRIDRIQTFGKFSPRHFLMHASSRDKP